METESLLLWSVTGRGSSRNSFFELACWNLYREEEWPSDREFLDYLESLERWLRSLRFTFSPKI